MQFKLGMQYWARLDYQKAFNWIKAAADRGQTRARSWACLSLWSGNDPEKYAQQRFKQAARRNNHEAQYLLGNMHRDGMGMPVSCDNRQLVTSW